MSRINSSSTRKLTTLALLAALAIVIGFFKFPIFPAAPFLEFDFADTPIIIGSLIFGAVPGLAILFVVSVIQAFLLGGSGIIGMIMHFLASAALIIVVSSVWRTKKNTASLIVGLVLGTITMAAVMIPLNLFLTPIYTGAPREVIVQMLLPVLIPFNLIKAGGNCIIAGILYKILQPFFKKNNLIG
ncbi:MAG: ECF transporter S component [Clostridia bacterium]|nr:ECF transporter S component [Clostridia bacterium]